MAKNRQAQPTQDDAGVAHGFRKGITNMRKRGSEPDIATNKSITADIKPATWGPGFTKPG